MSTDLILHHDSPPSLPKPIGTPADMIAHHDYITSLIRDVLVEGTDFGVIPGTKEATLYKPGAERINMAFGTHPEYEIVEREVDHYKENSHSKGTSLGIYRYIYRCQIVRHGIHQVLGEGHGSASSFESKYISRPRDLENTIIKMAKKRAFIDATLQTFALSSRFGKKGKQQNFIPNPIPDPPALFTRELFQSWLDKWDIKITPEQFDAVSNYMNGKPISNINEGMEKVMRKNI